jgi:hypothetical protein
MTTGMLRPYEVKAGQEADGSWAVWVGGHRARHGLTEPEATALLDLSPEDLVTDPWARRMMSPQSRLAARTDRWGIPVLSFQRQCRDASVPRPTSQLNMHRDLTRARGC